MSVNGKLAYRNWLKTSPEWETVRLLTLSYYEFRCNGCDKVDQSNHVHHLMYPKTWSATKMWHLRVLCKDCHEEIHKRTNPSSYHRLRQAIVDYYEAIKLMRELKGLRPTFKITKERREANRAFMESLRQDRKSRKEYTYQPSGRKFNDTKFYRRHRRKRREQKY